MVEALIDFGEGEEIDESIYDEGGRVSVVFALSITQFFIHSSTICEIVM